MSRLSTNEEFELLAIVSTYLNNHGVTDGSNEEEEIIEEFINALQDRFE